MYKNFPKRIQFLHKKTISIHIEHYVKLKKMLHNKMNDQPSEQIVYRVANT